FPSLVWYSSVHSAKTSMTGAWQYSHLPSGICGVAMTILIELFLPGSELAGLINIQELVSAQERLAEASQRLRLRVGLASQRGFFPEVLGLLRQKHQRLLDLFFPRLRHECQPPGVDHLRPRRGPSCLPHAFREVPGLSDDE